MVGNDVLFGDAQDDVLIGGYGADWISGGTGDDGILGDDGRVFISRNNTSVDEPLYVIAAIAAGGVLADWAAVLRRETPPLYLSPLYCVVVVT